jgi:serine/threonine protein kinase
MWSIKQKLQNRPYQIEGILAQGGFGITYKARHLQLNHLVVIKTPNIALQNDPEYPEYVERFIKEGQILAQLSQKAHPSIVRVNDLFQEGSIHCLVMDLIIGESLFDAVQKKGALPELAAVEIISQIGDALTVVHKLGMVHRDAHPGNIMLRDGTPAVLIDFGIAGEIMPTMLSSQHPANAAFAPYEQHFDGSREPTVDIYCLAASLYYTITGKTPTTALKRKIQGTALVSPKQHNSKISDYLNNAILQGLALEAKDRPQKMEDFLQLIQAKRSINIGLISTTPSVESATPAIVVNPLTTPKSVISATPKIVFSPIPITESRQLNVKLMSAFGVNYRPLQKLLVSGKWKEADLETSKKILEVAGRIKAGWLRVDDIDGFPGEDLRTIDQLWVKSSNELYGFSVQKRIYEGVGGTRKYNEKIWENFGESVGWRVSQEWLKVDDIKFVANAAIGHLPWDVWWKCVNNDGASSLLARKDL